MKYLSVCSGIEAATVAWHPLGWQPVAFGEIEKFPCQVLAHHYPDTPNWGDMTKFKEWPDADVNVFVGGTPCQSFSVAGLRKGLDDPRGNLMLTYLAIAARYRPEWLVWENVPGVLSSNGGLDFASLLRGMGECGYGFAYRILDAQYFGVAQRRRRVFVVGYLGNWRPAAAVLFERHSLSGHPAPSREKREGAAANARKGIDVSDYHVAGTLDKGILGRGIGHNGNYDSQVVSRFIGISSSGDPDVMNTLCATDAEKWGSNQWVKEGKAVLQPIALAENTIGRKPENGGNGDGFTEEGPMYTLNATGVHGVAQPIPLDMMNIRGRPSDDGRANRIGRGYGEVGDPMFTITKANHHGVAQPIAYAFDSLSSNSMKSANPASGCNEVDVSKALDTSRGLDPSCNQGGIGVAQPIAFDAYNQTTSDTVTALRCAAGGVFDNAVAQPVHCVDMGGNKGLNGGGILRELSQPLSTNESHAIQQAMAVRRLTPVECERFQGFPDNYTDIKPKGKATPDGPRYKALGNSMAVPVMAWIGKRIQEVDAICQTQKQ